MIEPPDLAALIPHGGAMVLLDCVEHWDATAIRCRARSHLDPANPLRRQGRLAAICALEYAFQAAALHGALLAGAPQRPGYVARLRDVVLHVTHLDDATFGALVIAARLERQEANGMLYALSIAGHDLRGLVAARASISLPSAGRPDNSLPPV